MFVVETLLPAVAIGYKPQSITLPEVQADLPPQKRQEILKY